MVSRTRRGAIFERFTDQANHVVFVAQEQARGLRHGYIGTEHLLLGLTEKGSGASADLLRSMGVTGEDVKRLVVRIVGEGDLETVEAAEEKFDQIPFTPRSKKVLELGLREALKLGHNYVDSRHLLLGLAREREGVAARILLDLDADEENIRAAVIRSFHEEGIHPTPSERSDAEAGEVEGEVELEGVEAVPTHPDRPATRDELGRERLAAVLAERIRRARHEDTEAAADTPLARWRKSRRDSRAARGAGSFLVHVHAPWGAGKSSLLNFLAADLRNRAAGEERGRLGRALQVVFGRREPVRPNVSQWIVVEFSAWQHQRLVPPWWWLLVAVHRACARELWRISRGRWLVFWVRDALWRLWNARVLAITGLLLLGLAVAAWQLDWLGLPDQTLTTVQTVFLIAVSASGLVTAVVQSVRGAGRWLAFGSAEGAARYMRRAHDPLRVYRRRFRWLVRAAGRPVAVFIDDLDRCRPAYVVELLEGIQTLFLDEPVTYVVAADRTWLCESFASTYEDFKDAVGEPGRPLGYLFLEKTFQVSLELKPMSPEDQDRYWRLLMRGTNEEEENAARGGDAELSSEFADASTQAEVEEEVRKLIGAGKDQDEVRAAAVRRMNAPGLQDQLLAQLAEFAPLLEKNPRSMKRLMNAYGIERDRLLRDGYLLTRAERGRLALLTIVQLRWPQLAEHLRRCPGDCKYCFDGRAAPADHDFASLFADPELREVISGKDVPVSLDEKAFVDFPGRPPD